MTQVFKIDEESAVGEARRAAAKIASRFNFSEVQSGQLALIVTEAARNMVRHAGGGELLLRPHHDTAAVHVLAIDKGPGIADVARSLRDGYSTGGTSGTGLGAIRRLSTEFDIYTSPGQGTAVFSCYAPQNDCDCSATAVAPTLLQVGVVNLPLASEEVSGDVWAVKRMPPLDAFMVCDGLGHGPNAAQAAREAERVFYEREGTPNEILERAHGAMRSTRGGAMAVVTRASNGNALFSGVGNIAATLVAGGQTRGLMSYNGIVGGQIHKLNEISFEWQDNATLIMHSDGLGTGWSLARYPGLLPRHPALIAAVLFRDFARGRDDVTVLVARPIA